MSKKQKARKDLTPKSSKLKPELTSPKSLPKWTVCPFCGLEIPKTLDDADEHSAESYSDKSDAILQHVLQLKEFKPEQTENKPLSWKFSKEPIFINKQTLIQLQGTVGSPVIINNLFIGYLSLVNDVKFLESSIGADKQFVDRVHEKFQSESVVVGLIPLPFIGAEEIHVLPLNADPLGIDPSFLRFAKSNMLLEFVTAGSEKTISFIGRSLRLRLVKMITAGGETIEWKQFGGMCACLGRSDNFEPRRFFQVVRRTKVCWLDKAHRQAKGRIHEALGGFLEQRGRIEEFMKHATLTEHDDYCPHGLLVCGPSGCGKTLLVRTVSSSVNVHLHEIGIADLNNCSSESEVRHLVEHLTVNEPCVVVFDKLHVFCSGSNPLPKGSSWNYTNAFANLIDFMRRNRRRVFFIGIADRFEDVHRDLLDAMRFGFRVDIGCPAVDDRSEIFKNCLASVPNKLSQSDVRKVAEETHGFVGHDFVTVCDIASGELSLSRDRLLENEEEVSVISFDDIMNAVKTHKQVLMHDSALAVNPVRWEDIGGQHELKSLLKRIVDGAVSSAYNNKMSWTEKGILLFGPPGCCKTMIAKAVATQCSTNFFAVQGPELLSKYVGESERMVRELFLKARHAAPSVIFFDEIDAIAGARDGGENDVTSGVLSTLLTEIGGIQSLNGVALIASTNLPNRIDPALLIPSRLGKHYYVRLPDADARREILRIQFCHRPIADDVDLEELVQKTQGFSGAELVGLCSKAASQAMIEDLSASEIKYKHFLSTLNDIVPLASQEMLDMYEKFAEGSRYS